MEMPSLKPVRTAKEDVQQSAYSREKEQPLSPIARMFHETDSNMYIITIIGFKTKVNPQVIKANLVHTLLKQPRFSSLQVVDERKSGVIKWVRTKVDLDNHVRIPMLDPNMESTNCDMFVEDYISNLSKTSISMLIPMWDLHILDIKTTEAESLLILRVHHSIGDGTSLMSLLLSCTRQLSDPDALPTLPNARKRAHRLPSNRGFWEYFSKIWLVLLVWWNTVVDVMMLLLTAFFLEDTETPLKGSPDVGSTPRRIVHRTVSLDDVKLVKNAMNMTINDVMMGVTQAALTRFLNGKYGEDKKDVGGERQNNLPKNIRLRAVSFVNIRPSAGIQELSEMMKTGSQARWGNKIGYVLFPFTIALRKDPLDYIRDAKRNSDRKKASREAVFTYFMAKFFLKFRGNKLAKFPTRTTLWFSNVPGPQEEIAFCRYPVAYIAPSCCGQPSALTIHVVSYVNKMKIILSVDESIVPDPHQLCDDLEESLMLIKDAVSKRTTS